MDSFFEQFQICEGFQPVNMATAANDGDWVCVRDYGKLVVLLYKGIGTAGEDPTLTIEQATSAAGAGAKALNFTTVYKKQAATDLQTTAAWTKVTQASGNTFTHTDLAEQAAIIGIEFDAEDFDTNGGFLFARGRVADVGAAAQIGGLCYILCDARYRGATLPSAIA